jgi:hypothetical protein
LELLVDHWAGIPSIDQPSGGICPASNDSQRKVCPKDRVLKKKSTKSRDFVFIKLN